MQKVVRLIKGSDDASYTGRSSRASGIAASGKAPPLNCILMDDSDFDRKLIRRLAEKSRFDLNVVETSSIEETRNWLAHRKMDILIADYRIPDGDGIRFAGDLVKAGINAPQVIVVTGDSDPTAAIHAIRAGAADYLPKSEITLDLFEGAIENAMRARGRITAPDEMQRDEAIDALKSLQEMAAKRGHDLKAAILPLIALGWQISQGKTITDKKRTDISSKIDDLARRIPEMLDDLVIASVCGLDNEPEMHTDLNTMVGDIIENESLGANITCNLLPVLIACPKRMRLLLESLIGASIVFCPPGRYPEIQIGMARDPSGNPIIWLQDNGISLDVRKQTLGSQMSNLAIAGENGDPFIWSMCQRVAQSLGAALKIKPGSNDQTMVMLRFDKSRLV